LRTFVDRFRYHCAEVHVQLRRRMRQLCKLETCVLHKRQKTKC
jgi:hypothetical protein